jgi:mannitol/fructose-specific phosphotransferase system IIA component (Ntr-type)
MRPSVRDAVTKPADFIADPDVVLLDLPASTGEEAVRTLHAALAEHAAAVTDAPRFLAELIDRMRLSPVTIAEDIALPHARTDAVSRLVLAIGRAPDGVPFDVEHPRVRLVFLIGTPRSAVTEYLRVVAALTRLLRDPAVRSGLMTATDENEFRSMLASRAAAKR